MKIALAQTNSTVGDVAGNTGRTLRAIGGAAAAGAEMVVLPELALSGYPPQDLVQRPAFIEANEAAVHQVAEGARGIWAVVGYVGLAAKGSGRLAANSAAVLRDGQLLERRDKTLLPTYDVFDEQRHFQAACCNRPLQLGTVAIGLTICEDAWNDRSFWKRPLYERDPVEKLAESGIDILLNLSASPFAAGKQQFRREMLAATARRHGVPLVYVNLVGGNDQLIFDGRSMVFGPHGQLVAEAGAFREDLLVIDTARQTSATRPELVEEVEETYLALDLGLRDYVRKCGFKKAVLALSGGVDSAVTAAIAAGALGPGNVTALYMPTTFSSDQSRCDAEAVASNLGIELVSVPIEDIRTCSERALTPLFEGTERGVAEENVQARIRGMLVMAYANKFGHLPLATGNKSELAVGYCTLYGDMVGGLAVIGDVPKTMVYRIARHLNSEGEVIPRSVLEKAPTAELKPDQTDQDVLPPYEVLDEILNLHIEQNLELADIVKEGFEAETVSQVLTLVDRAEFKRRQAPITLRVTAKAFGPGRRLPVAQNWPG
ncbi:MAG: NAD+ synthase [Planctomycetota bacterium]|jgi:NAD+ synthetase